MKTGTINGLVVQDGQYAIKNFLSSDNPIKIGTHKYESYESAIKGLAGKFYPESFYPYLEAVKGITPDINTWMNLIYLGDANGHYDHETKKRVSAREKGMEPSSDIQDAYLRALMETYNTITHFTPNA